MEDLFEGRHFFQGEQADHQTPQHDGQRDRTVDHRPVPGPTPLTEYFGPFIKNPPRWVVGSRRKTESRSTHSKAPVPQARCTLAARPTFDSSMQPMARRFLKRWAMWMMSKAPKRPLLATLMLTPSAASASNARTASAAESTASSANTIACVLC